LEDISPIIAKIFSVVQFPWRYLSVASIFAVTATVIAMQLIKEHKKDALPKIICATLTLFTLLCAGLFYTNFADTAAEYRVYGGADVVQDTVGGEYMITGTVEGDMRWRSVIADLSAVGVAGYQSDHGKVMFVCDNTSDSEQLVQVPIQNYDNYHAYTSDGQELETANGDNNRIGIWIPSEYSGVIKVAYEIPLIWKVSYVISALTLIVIIAAYIAMGRREKRIGKGEF
jgi:hypothetical protein